MNDIGFPFDRAGAAVETAPEGHAVLTGEGRFVEASAAWCAICGLGWQELRRLTLVDLATPDFRQPTVDALRVAARDGRASLEAAWTSKDGGIAAVDVALGRRDGAQGGYFCFVRDITRRPMAESALTTRETMFRHIAETIQEVFWIVTPDWQTVSYVSPAYERIWGRSVDALYRRGMDWLDAVVEADRPALLAAIPRPESFSRCSEVRFPDYRIRRPDGDQRWISARAYPARDDAGRVVHFTGIAEDITARKRAECDLLAAKKSAEAASHAKSRFLAAASHDLRQPMQAITLFGSALERTRLSEEQRHIVDNLERSASALGGLLDALLHISRLDAGVVKLSIVLVDLYDIFRRIDHEFASSAMEKGLRFKLYFPDRRIGVRTDPELLMGMLRNLIGNALKYTARGGVLVGARRRGAGLLMQVWDTGIGIAHENLPLIQDEFYQVDNRQRDRAQGLGLGLSIAKRLAALLGCEIGCRSRPGRGSVFELVIPTEHATVADDVGTLGSGVAGEIDIECLRGRHVTLVEDDALVAESLRLWFRSFGATVSLYSGAEQLLADPRATSADLYLSDFRLPGAMNGVELLETLRQRSPLPVRAIVITGDGAATTVGSLAATRWKVLHKPIDARRLLAAIAELWADDDAATDQRPEA